MKYDLIFTPLSDLIQWGNFEVKPTACLLVADSFIRDTLLADVVVAAIKLGCTYFITWGSQADSLHDRINGVLESGDEDWMSESLSSGPYTGNVGVGSVKFECRS